ncbi:alkylglycerol monooxygenase-like [Neocloeon triangulifer]|uniref:alkylglycerol monooxygenase-like n=1 Tax=Neocloeon triangulifer TaxID=2078957 RepID=UPI00286F5A13|nr:alkylglycerol monooxygenase-like [Neocloeon triangulifer]
MGNATDVSAALTQGLARFFYAVDPLDTSYPDHKHVPDFFVKSWPYFLVFMALENLLLYLEGRPTVRLNDSITSLSHGLIQHCGKLIFRGAESAAYIFIYQRFRLVDLAWDNALTWYLAALGVDFCYYWVHRASHEVHVLWAQHQVHHSSEDYNIAVGLRQSILQGWCGFIFYLPLAFFIPPAHFLTHQQFSLLFQFWLHTEAIRHLGPLEWVFNTPRHHRVHHGANLFCLDKNYGGVLIIWDRLFGTFANEKEDEEIVYGLVFNQPSFNPVWLQYFYSAHVVHKWQSMEGWRNKLSAVFKGPSWIPGAPWTGRDEDKIKVGPRQKFDVSIPTWCNVYLLIHFVVVVFLFQELYVRHVGMSQISVILFVGYILLSLTTIGLLFENKGQARAFELFRCVVFATLLQRGHASLLPQHTVQALQTFFGISAAFWTLQSMAFTKFKHA